MVAAVSVDIPNDGVQDQTEFPRDLRDQINNDLLAIAQTEEAQEALNMAYQRNALEHNDQLSGCCCPLMLVGPASCRLGMLEHECAGL